MKFFVIESCQLIVGWSPKCACTAVADWLVNGIVKPNVEIKKHREFLIQEGFLKDAQTVNQLLNDNFKLVVVAREPYGRIASAFINKFIVHSGQPLIYPKRFEKFSLNFIENFYSHINFKENYRGISFIEFLNYIKYCQENNIKLNDHWNLQQYGLTKELKNNILSKRCFFVKQETFNHDIANINYALGIDYVPTHQNVSICPQDWNDIPKTRDLSNFTNQVIVRRKLRIAKENFLTQETKSLIAYIYQEDFKLFGYKP